jgi:hypothetical protein
MFQSVRDAETRRALGEHYTSEENILKTLNPLFLDELREEFTAALARDTTQKKVNSLNKLWERLGDTRFMDPACGCGNFIIVAYRELRAIELQVMEALHSLNQVAGQETLGGDLVRQIRVTLDHFYGIEIDEWPARIAETAMFMIDRAVRPQASREFWAMPPSASRSSVRRRWPFPMLFASTGRTYSRPVPVSSSRETRPSWARPNAPPNRQRT